MPRKKFRGQRIEDYEALADVLNTTIVYFGGEFINPVSFKRPKGDYITRNAGKTMDLLFKIYRDLRQECLNVHCDKEIDFFPKR